MYKLKLSQNIVLNIIILHICIALYFLSRYNYTFYHTAIELSTIIFGFSSLAIALGTKTISKNYEFYILSLMLSFVGFIDLSHALSYDVINIFTNNPNLSIQMRVIGNYYEILMISILLLGEKKRFSFLKVILLNILFIGGFSFITILFKFFPTCYVNDCGLTLFKRVSECLISVGYFFMLIFLIKRPYPQLINKKIFLVKYIVFKILAEVCFSSYVSLSGTINFFGHLFKFISYLYIIQIMFRDGIVSPYKTIFDKLNRKITELEEANKSLKEANKRVETTEYLYNKFINFIPDGVLVIRDYKLEFVNKKFLKMLDITDEKLLINKNILDLVNEPYHEIVKTRMYSKNIQFLETPQQYELIFNKKIIWVEATSLIVKDEKGEYLICTVRDIQDRKKSEEFQQLLQLRQKEDQMKNEFFSNISHELRTPINVIYSALQLENQYLDNHDIKSLKSYNAIITKNCLRLIRLVNNLIDITKIDSDFFKANIKTENIVSLVEDITHSIIEYVKAKNIELIFDTEIEEGYVDCDTVLIERIIFNLLSNSIKFSQPNGNILVYIFKTTEDEIAISIKDNGVGISEDVKERIFNRFLKGDTSLSRKAEGSGIGLYLVKKLVELQKGHIRFDSTENLGTEFVVTFPLSESASEVCADAEKARDYEKNIIKLMDMEFSDIYG
jgi:PAS domain S-box-containing protein